MAQKKPAAKKSGAKKPDPAKRARNKDGTYKGDDKSTPDVNEAYESPKPGTKATTKPRNPAAKQREATAPKKPAAKKAVAKKPAAKKPAQKKPHTYAPKVKSPVEELLDTPPPTLSRYEPPVKKKSRAARIWGWFVGE
tara:strand:+ start:215 stop:628 length:414 start_codon:yes stop_codon:yes gene_type:complete